MKKAIALLSTLFLIVSLVPMGAFADSYPGFSNLVMNHSFSWYSDFPYVDTNGFIYNSYLQSATLVSNGVTSHPSPTTVPTLYQDGDYFEVSFDSDILSGYQTPLWNVLIAYDSSTYSSHYDIPNDSIICYLNNELAFYEFQTNLTMDNRKWRCISFICQGNYLENTTIKIEYDGDGTPIQIPITMICFRGYRFTPSGSLTTQEMIELQSNIVNALNTARLADIIGNINTSVVDLTTLENTTSSILNALSDLPDILTYIKSIDQTDYNIYSAINNFYSFYINQYSDITVNKSFIDVTYYPDIDSTNNSVQFSTTPQNISNNQFYLTCRWSNNDIDINALYMIFIPFTNSWVERIYDIDYYLDSSAPYRSSVQHYKANYINGISYGLYIVIPYISNYQGPFLHLSIKSNYNVTLSSNINAIKFGYSHNTQNQFYRIFELLKQLVSGNSTIPSDIETTTQQIQQQTQTVDTFHQSAETELNTGLQNVPVNDYQITATTGTQYMKQYTENLFTASNGFRIWFMYPLILATIALLIRWRYSR